MYIRILPAWQGVFLVYIEPDPIVASVSSCPNMLSRDQPASAPTLLKDSTKPNFAQARTTFQEEPQLCCHGSALQSSVEDCPSKALHCQKCNFIVIIQCASHDSHTK